MEKEQIREACEYVYKKADNYTERTIKWIRGCITRGFLDIGDFSHCGDNRYNECNFMQKVLKNEILRIQFKLYNNER